MPEVTGGLGYIVDANDTESCVKTLYTALEQENSGQYRQIIEKKFSSGKRASMLLEIIGAEIK